MQIQGPGPLSGPDKVAGRIRGGGPPARGPSPRAGEDRVELSDAARFMERLKRLPEIRSEKVRALREAIASGRYDTDEKLRVAVERVLEDLEDLGLTGPIDR